MKTAAEWSNDFFFGKKFNTIAELVREVREEMAEEAAKLCLIAPVTRCVQHQRDGSGCCGEDLADAIRQLKEKP